MAGPAWQRRQREALRAQLTGTIGPYSPLWRDRLSVLGRTATSITSAADLAALPALGERDVSPSGDPAGMARLVVHGGEAGFALHAPAATVRRALLSRLLDRSAYRQIVDSEMRATTFAWTGLAFRWPVAYTRGDLDVVARAGARAWRLLGLTADDAVLTVTVPEPEPGALALQYAALATGTPLVAVEPVEQAVARAARLTPPTVVAVPPGRADLVAAAVTAMPGGSDRLRTVLLLGVPDAEQRASAGDAAGAQATVLVWHVPSGARLPWVECRGSGAGGGLHAQPDLEVVQLVDPETGEPVPDDRGGEPVVSQLGMRGSALLRWRTGDLAETITTGRCPGCGQHLPRLLGVRAGMLVAPVAPDSRLDLRAVAGALAGRADLTDWRIVAGPRPRDGQPQVVVHFVPVDPVDPPVVGLADDLRAAAGALPSQLVLTPPGELDAVDGRPVTRRIRGPLPG